MSRTALVIDNDDSTVSQTNAALSPLGYSVSSASDAAAGLGMANNLVPSIMLVNLATPGSNGLELCKSIHGTDHLKDVPIILLTLREGKFDPVYVKLYGIVAFLKKPFNDDELISLINEFSTATEAPPAVEAVEAVEEVYAEPEAEAFEEVAFAEPAAEQEAFTAEAGAYEDADATMAMTMDDTGGEAMALEAEGGDEGFEETVTLSDEESDLGELQASFSGDQYAGDETAAIDEAARAPEESFDFGAAPMMESEGAEAAQEADAGGGWGDMSTEMAMAGSGSEEQADETWGGMGGDMSMSDSFGTGADEEGPAETDAFAAAEVAAEGFDTGGGFDAEGTMALDSGSAEAFDAGGQADFSTVAETGEFDSGGTMAMDSGAKEDLDIGGFQASKDAAPSEGEGFGFDDGADESAWGESGIESAPASGKQPDSLFDDSEEAFSSGFEEDAGEGGGISDIEGFGGDDEISFDGDDAGFESDFLEEPAGSEAAFSGDDQDYTGLFEPVTGETPGEEAPVEEKKGKKKKKKFKKAAPSKFRRILVLLLLLVIAGGGAYQYRDMLPFEIPDIKMPDIKMPDIKIPFIGKDSPDEPAEPAKRPPKAEPEKPKARKQVKPEPAKPSPDIPRKIVVKPPVKKGTSAARKAESKVSKKPVKKEPVAPRQKTVKAPAKKARKAATGAFKKGYHYVQFGVFGNARNAEILSSQLNRKGLPTLKRKITSNGRKLTVVLLDRPYKTRGSAEKRAKAISDKTGFDTAVYR
jgi:twitching motility two-component system response regulator PilG